MTPDIQSNNKRIARNTFYMYLRMGVTMLVQLYTSRIILDSLGIDNYGIYNIVATVVIMFTFVSGPLASATQRFFNFELGKPDGGEINKIFNISLLAYLALTIILFIALEAGGGWYVANKLNVPPEKTADAMWVFQLSVASLMLSLMSTPFVSLILSHERMDFYAYTSVAEVILKLANAYSLVYFAGDRLRLYAVNQLLINAIITLCIILYCRRNFLHIRIRRIWDKAVFKSLLSFSGWTLLSSVTTMGATNGVNILLNSFFGVAVNSAMGIATQVSTAINQFVTNFQVAFNPQIVKYCSAGLIGQMQSLAYRAAKISYLLLLMLVCPLFFNIDFILEIWLKEVPPYTGALCLGLIVWSLLESLMAPLWTSVTATGNVKVYHIVMSLIIASVFLLSWACLAAGFSPVSVVIVKCLVDLVLIVTRLLFTRRLLGFSIRAYITAVIMPVTMVTAMMGLVICLAETLPLDGWTKLVTDYAADFLFILPVTYFLAFSRDERAAISGIIRQKLQLSPQTD